MDNIDPALYDRIIFLVMLVVLLSYLLSLILFWDWKYKLWSCNTVYLCVKVTTTSEGWAYHFMLINNCGYKSSELRKHAYITSLYLPLLAHAYSYTCINTNPLTILSPMLCVNEVQSPFLKTGCFFMQGHWVCICWLATNIAPSRKATVSQLKHWRSGEWTAGLNLEMTELRNSKLYLLMDLLYSMYI